MSDHLKAGRSARKRLVTRFHGTHHAAHHAGTWAAHYDARDALAEFDRAHPWVVAGAVREFLVEAGGKQKAATKRDKTRRVER